MEHRVIMFALLCGAVLLLFTLPLGASCTIKLIDGCAIQSDSPPLMEGRLCILRTMDGRIISIRKDLIASIHIDTEKADVPTRAPSPLVQPLSRPPRSYTNEDLVFWNMTDEQWKEKAAHAQQELLLARESPGAWSILPYRDMQGRSEDYWHPLARDATEAVDRAQAGCDRLKNEYEELIWHFGEPVGTIAAYSGVIGYYNDSTAVYILSLKSRIAEAEADLHTAQQRLSDIQEDARKAGALPGWLR